MAGPKRSRYVEMLLGSAGATRGSKNEEKREQGGNENDSRGPDAAVIAT